MSRSSRRPLSWGEKWLFLGCPFLLLFAVALVQFNASREAMPVINYPAPLPRPIPNGYDLYVKASTTLKLPTDLNSDIAVDGVHRSLPQLRLYLIARRQKWLKANAPGLNLLSRALKTPCMAPDARTPTNQSALSTAVFNWSALLSILETRVIAAKMTGDWNASTQAGLDIMQMGADLSRGGDLGDKIHNDAFIYQGWHFLDDAADDVPGHLSAAQARVVTTRLETILDSLPTYVQAAQTSRWADLSTFQRLAGQSNWRRQIYRQPLPPLSWSQRLALQLQSKRDIVQHVNALYETAIADFKRPYSVPSTSSFSPSKLQLTFVSPVVNMTTMFRADDAHNRTGMGLLLLRFALQAYHAEHGAFPAALTALTPSYLQHLPTDLYADGKPFHYQRQGSSYKIWSVGRDGIDNGGAITAPQGYATFYSVPSNNIGELAAHGDWGVNIGAQPPKHPIP